MNVVIRDGGVDQLLEFADVASDRHFECFDPPSVAGEREDRGLPVGDGRDIDPPRGAHDGVGDLGIAHIDFGRVLRQIDDDRLADAELEIAGETRPLRKGGVGRRRASGAHNRGTHEAGRGERDGAGQRMAFERARHPSGTGCEERRGGPHHRIVCAAPNRTSVRLFDPLPASTVRRRAAAVGEAPQHEMEVRISAALREDHEIGLIRVELQRRIRAGDDLLAVLLLDVLPDREDPHIRQNGPRVDDFHAARLRRLLVPREIDDVDAVVRKNEAARGRVAAIVDLDRHGAHPARQDGRQEAARARLHELVAPDRLAADEGRMDHRPPDPLRRVAGVLLGDHQIGQGRLRPGLPRRAALAEHRPHRQILSRDEDLIEFDLRGDGSNGRRRPRGLRAAGEKESRGEGRHRNRSHNEEAKVHQAALREI